MITCTCIYIYTYYNDNNDDTTNNNDSNDILCVVLKDMYVVFSKVGRMGCV